MNNIYMQAALALSAGDVTVLQGELNGNTTAVLESTSSTAGGKVSRARKGDNAEVSGPAATLGKGCAPATVSEPSATKRGADIVSEPSATGAAAAVSADADGDNTGRTRQYQSHDWPEIGAVLTAEYYGRTYRARVIPAGKKLLSGRQLCIESGPAAGVICDSLSAAMLAATEKQRKDDGLRRKGVANGWDFWSWDGK